MYVQIINNKQTTFFNLQYYTLEKSFNLQYYTIEKSFSKEVANEEAANRP